MATSAPANANSPAKSAPSDLLESAFTVALVPTPLEQIAHKIASIPNIVFGNAGIREIIDSELQLGLAEALDAQAIAIINAAGMTAGGTGSSLAARIRKAMTVVQAAGFKPNTVALSPADARSSRSSGATSTLPSRLPPPR